MIQLIRGDRQFARARTRRPTAGSSACVRFSVSVSGLLLFALALLMGCNEVPDASPEASGSAAQPAAPHAATREPGPAAYPLPPTNRVLFFGDLHVHSGWSIDAWASGVRANPSDAYRYARGEAVGHPSGAAMQMLGPPLDFMAVTDHSEYLGVTLATQQQNHPLRRQALIQTWIGPDRENAQRAWARIRNTFYARVALPALVSDEVLQPAWKAMIADANQHYVPGEFTTLIGFEYSPNPQGQNLHRNVLFRGDSVPTRPFSSMDSLEPEALWAWMDQARATGDDVLAIPHNANGSNGLMFARKQSSGRPIDARWAERRRRNEPLAEVFQIKGQSETAPPLSPEDEWAGFEYIPWRTADPNLPSQTSGSYLRDALKTGLEIEAAIGVNPYALGAVGSTDGHNATSPFEERNYSGKLGATDGTPKTRLALNAPNADGSPTRIRMPATWGAAGIAGIWAERNNRGALFDALRRRETFATSGPRIRVRMFGGWDFEPADATGDFAAIGYARGIAMGGELTRPSTSVDAVPSFLVSAQQDPSGARLERIQIIKGWLENGVARERVFDVACGDGSAPDPDSARCPHSAPSPDLAECAPSTELAASELSTAWRDPDHYPKAASFYYARVLEVPTCRWSTWDANRLGIKPLTGLAATIQERAVTSSIWIPAQIAPSQNAPSR